LARLFAVVSPGLDIKPLISELRERVAEELDYRLEASSQQGFATAFAGDPDILVPHVVAGSDRVIVTEWVDGTPLSTIIDSGTREQRNRAGLLYARFLFSGPARSGMLHADPHPGNYRLLDDGRLGVLDFGAVNRLPGGFPEAMGRLMRLAMVGDHAAVLAGLKEEGFIKPGVEVEPQTLLNFLAPFLDPAREETFHFTRTWLRSEAIRVGDPRSPDSEVGRQINLPPTYLLIHRVWLGSVGVLCQLDAEGPFRAELYRWLPGFAS
jgi:predicted unusual protein kinase regulating ubiquinone biosynthesis (AarF/ABC1/UbiB family)